MEEAIDEFLKYTKPYKKYGPMINLKIEHTLRVKDLCKEIEILRKIGNEYIEEMTNYNKSSHFIQKS